MRVLILTQWYPPEPGLLMQELAQTLQDRGHDVTVLTGFPNYPSGKVYPGYRIRPWMRETIERVPIVRVALYPEHSRSGIKRALNYLSFAISCSFLAPFLVRHPDVLFVYHPPLTAGIPAIWLSWLWRAPYVYQVQDLWPETLAATGMLTNRRIIDWIARLARSVYARAAAICVSSPGFRSNLLAKGVPARKIHVISNWVDTAVYRPVEPGVTLGVTLGLAGRFNVMFAGNLGEAQGLETILDAAALLQGLPDIQFVLVGDGTAARRIEHLAQVRQLQNVRFLRPRPPGDMPDLYAHADVLLMHLKDDPLFRITVPHKTFAYMASGKPVLAAISGDAAAVISTAGAGLVCQPEDAGAMAAAVRRMYDSPRAIRQQMAQNGLDAIRERFSRPELIGRLEAVLREARG
jgi:colanic acid biosynthesis glycosyl transferase WcaI